jgi:hypothetical protein
LGLGNTFWTYKSVLRGSAELSWKIYCSESFVFAVGGGAGEQGKIATVGKKKEHPFVQGPSRGFLIPAAIVSGVLVLRGAVDIEGFLFAGAAVVSF